MWAVDGRPTDNFMRAAEGAPKGYPGVRLGTPRVSPGLSPGDYWGYPQGIPQSPYG